MRLTRHLLLAIALSGVSGCAMFDYYLDSSTVNLRHENGTTISSETYVSGWDGNSYVEWHAYNPNNYPMCAQVYGKVNTDGGASWGGVHLVGPGQRVYLGYVGTGGSFSYDLEYRLWGTTYGECRAYSSR
jgi:hypothetical protein